MPRHELEPDPEDPRQIKMFDDIDLAKMEEPEACPECGEQFEDCTCTDEDADVEDGEDL
jgi:hypothetical protein